MTSPIRVDRHGGVALITLERSDRLNAIGTGMVDSLSTAVEQIARDTSVAAVVVTGAGRAFSAGADISEFASCAAPAQFEAFIAHMASTFRALGDLPQPSVAAINGVALGGGLELALACDLRVASAGARLGVPEIKLGLLPGAGGTARLTRLLTPGAAKQLLLTGEALTAQEALRLGLVNEVTEDGPAALARALEIAGQLAVLPAGALAAAKRLVDEGGELSLDGAIALERATVVGVFASADREEGVAAFLEKRPPHFDNRRT